MGRAKAIKKREIKTMRKVITMTRRVAEMTIIETARMIIVIPMNRIVNSKKSQKIITPTRLKSKNKRKE